MRKSSTKLKKTLKTFWLTAGECLILKKLAKLRDLSERQVISQALKEHFEALSDEPVSIELAGFADLIEQIENAQAEDVKFTDDPIPSPDIALK